MKWTILESISVKQHAQIYFILIDCSYLRFHTCLTQVLKVRLFRSPHGRDATYHHVERSASTIFNTAGSHAF